MKKYGFVMIIMQDAPVISTFFIVCIMGLKPSPLGETFR